ncbi:hypothetical protein OH769_19870 [[Kitasatospora] papulosa]|uniref:Uncharacterized protein n=1 Tax=[Kitasatospora] papulosa TaxID=1464011 RepID=A0ABZ1K441_9ACTN|nr:MULTISPECIES: hypothetical protein [unclassified Streptomyces]MCY1651953.1 hypothetical protein [Streptomyces sp. SL203]MCY1680852.1 hypothetical protein [Streptomyces sp. SL294]WKV79703.1 hypothetical protein HBB06_16950 [Streptomyces sp. SNU607]
MLDTTPLITAVDRFADRLRSAPQSRLQQGVAAAALVTARDLSARAQRAEAPDREPRIMPDAGIFAVGDQLAVAGRDLAVALETASSQELDEAVRCVEEAAERAFAPGSR